MSKSIVAVVVTYNRLDLLKKCIQCLRDQTHTLSKIIVVNNGSTDGTEGWLNLQNDLSVFHQANSGGSGGFHRGIKEAYAAGFDWVWIMDDDAFAENNAVAALVSSITRHGDTHNYCLYSNNDEDAAFETNEKEITHVMFVGFAIPFHIVSEVGLPRSDFFIYWDDAEYCERINNSGFKIYKLKDCVLNHRSFTDNQFYKKKFFTITVTFHKMSDWKLFYYLRNRLLMHKPFSYKWIKTLVYTCYLYAKILYLSNQGVIATKAIYNGLARKSGTYQF